jgi:MYXO-CTERM domain-containing protein
VLTALGWALFAAIQPLGIVAFIAMLGSRGGRRNTLGFIIGWLLCAGLVAVVTVLVAGGTSRSGHVSATISSAGLLQIALGLVALGFLVVRRRRRAGVAATVGGAEPLDDLPAEAERAVGPVGAALIAAMLQGWPIVAAAVAAVLDATDSGAGQTLGILLVIVVSASTYLVAHVLAGLYPERTAAWLAGLRRRIETHRDRVIDLVLLGAGAWLIGHGLVVQLTQ